MSINLKKLQTHLDAIAKTIDYINSLYPSYAISSAPHMITIHGEDKIYNITTKHAVNSSLSLSQINTAICQLMDTLRLTRMVARFNSQNASVSIIYNTTIDNTYLWENN